jgi:hypothetical protein
VSTCRVIRLSLTGTYDANLIKYVSLANLIIYNYIYIHIYTPETKAYTQDHVPVIQSSSSKHLGPMHQLGTMCGDDGAVVAETSAALAAAAASAAAWRQRQQRQRRRQAEVLRRDGGWSGSRVLRWEMANKPTKAKGNGGDKSD